MANNRIVVQQGQSAGAIGGIYDVFGTNLGAETVTVYDNTTVFFQGDFSRGGDTIRLTDVATDFTVSISGSNAILTSVSDGIRVEIPIGSVGTTIVFENSAGNLVDSRVLIFNGTNVLLGGQVVTGTTTPLTPSDGGNSSNTIVLTAGVDTAPGGAADDTFIGFNRTLNAGDALDGGAGYNTLRLSADTSLTGIFEGPFNYGGFTTKNVQRIEVTNDDDQAISLDLSGTEGVQVVAAKNSSQSIAFNQLTNLTTIELNNVTNPAIGGPDVTVEFQDSVVAGATAVNVVLKTSKADNLTIGSVSDAEGGIETVNLSNEVGVSSLDTLITDLTTLNIKATKDLTIDDALSDTVRTIDATGSTATLDINFQDNDDAGEGVTYIGSTGKNIVLGGNAGDSITTFGGDDAITTDDNFTGADGNDTVNAGDGNNTVNSGNGADSITSGTGNDVINARNGANFVNAGAGNNNVTTGTGNDTIVTLGGADTISSGDGDDDIDSGDGADFITVGAGEHTIRAGAGNDTVVVADDQFNADGEVNPLDSFAFGDGTDELRIAQGVASAEAFTNVSSLEVLTQTEANHALILNDGGDADAVNEAQAAGIQIINTDWNYVGNDTVNASGFTSALTVNIGGYTGDANGVGGGTDSIVTGSGNDTIVAPGNNNVQDNDTINGNAGTDTLILDGDTTLTTASNFKNIERIVLLDENESIDENLYSITLDNDNAPSSNGTLTIDGNVLNTDEGVFISSAAVTNYSISVIGGEGDDYVVSGNQGDTIVTNAGSDTVEIGLGGADSVSLGDGADSLIADGGLTSTDTVAGGAGEDTIDASNAGRNLVDADFTNASTFEVLEVAEGFTSTLGTKAQAAGIVTIVSDRGDTGTVIDASGYTVGVKVDVSATGGGLNNDKVTTGSGNDTVIAGVGDQNFSLGAGNDQVLVDGTEQTFADSIDGGLGDDTVFLDNSADEVVAGVNLSKVSGVENFNILASGDTSVFTDVDNNVLTFTGGNVGTLTQINVSAAALTDADDSFRVRLAPGQLDADYQFNVTGSSTLTIVEKDNFGVDNNIKFTGGTGVDRLIIDGDDLGSTVTMDGGDGIDEIVQSQISGGQTQLTDDAFVNVSNVEVLTGEFAGDLNATLGAEAADAGIVTIRDTAGNDVVNFDAAFDNAVTINLTTGNDKINGKNTAAALTINVLDTNVSAADTLVGGSSAGDVLNVTAGNAGVGGGDLTNVTFFETINVKDGGLASTTLIVDTAANEINATSQKIDASELDSNEILNLVAGGAGANLSVIGGAGSDSIVTGSGADTVAAGEGNNTIITDGGADSVTSGSGNDSIRTGNGNDTVNAGDGNNTVFGGQGNDNITTGSGNDLIDDGAGDDTVSSGAGDDQIYGAEGADLIDSGTGKDQLLYRALGESSTSTARDTVIGFESGSDVIDIRYVQEAISKYGEGATIRFAGNLANFGKAQGAIIAGDGILDIVYQQDDQALWVDLNDDGVLNGNDIQIVLQGTTSIAAADVLDTLATGAVVGATLVPTGSSVTGTFLNDRFLLQGTGPWTVDGGLGTDTVVIKNGQNISTSDISNVEIAEVNNAATMTYEQHNDFDDITDGKTAGNPNITLVGVVEKVQGDADVETYTLAGTEADGVTPANDDFSIGGANQSVNAGDGDDTIRSLFELDVDDINGTIDGGAGFNTLILDANDDISDATLINIDQTIITQSSVTMNVFQHGSNGSNGTAGQIVDAGDTFPNSTDTITFSNSTLLVGGVTGLADIENYVLSGGNDKFTLGSNTQNVNTGAGTNEIVTGVFDDISGTLGGSGTDTLTLDDGDNIGGTNVATSFPFNFPVGDGDVIVGAADISAVENIKLTGGTVQMTLAQHNAVTISDTGLSDTVVLSTGGTLLAQTPVDTYIAGGNTNTNFVLNAANGDVNVVAGDANDFEDTITVNGGTWNGTWTVDGTTDTLVATGGNDISGVNTGNATTLETLTLTGDLTLTEKQHEGFTTVNGTGTNTVTLSSSNGDDSITGAASIENYVLNDTFTFTLGAAGQNVTGNGAQNQNVVVNGLVLSGNTLDGGALGNDTLTLNNGSDISGLGLGAITNFENVIINGSVTMTYAQYNLLLPTGGTGTDTITFVGPVAAITARNAIENYVLANIAGNNFSFAAGTGTVSVTTSGSNNDIVQTGTQTSFAGVTLNLAGNTGFVGDILKVSTTGTDLSGLNGGAETTAETLNIDGIAAVSMTVAQHEGFTADFLAAGNNTVTLTDGGEIFAEQFVETYVLDDLGNKINVNPLNTTVNITGNVGNDTVVLDGIKMTGGTWNLGGGTDTLIATTGSSISAVNGGLAADLDLLNLAGKIEMTELQYEDFTTIVAAAGNDHIVLSASNGDDAVAGNAVIEKYTLNDVFSFTIADTTGDAVGTSKQSVIGDGDFDQRVIANNLVLTGTLNGGTGAGDLLGSGDVFVAEGLVDISATTFSNFEAIEIAGGANLTLTELQYESVANYITGSGLGDQAVTLNSANGDGVITGESDIEDYYLNAAFTFNYQDSGVETSVFGNNDNAQNIVIDNESVGTGNTFDGGTKAGVVDTLTLYGTTDISGNTVVNFETLALGGAGGVAASSGSATMTVTQYKQFSDVVDLGGTTDTVNLTGTGTGTTKANALTADTAVDTYNFTGTSGGSRLIIGGSSDINIVASTTFVDLDVTGTQTGNWTGSGASDFLYTTGTTSIAGVNAGLATGWDSLRIDGTLTLTGAQYNDFSSILDNPDVVGADTTADTVIITTSGSYVADAQIENYTINGTSTLTFDNASITDTQLSGMSAFSSSSTTFVINQAAVNGAVDSSITFNNIAPGTDEFRISVGGTLLDNLQDNVLAGTPVNLGAGVEGAIISGTVGFNFTDVSDGGAVELAIAQSIGSSDLGAKLFVIENFNGTNQSAFYLVNVSNAAAASNLETSNFEVEFIGLVNTLSPANWSPTHFA